MLCPVSNFYDEELQVSGSLMQRTVGMLETRYAKYQVQEIVLRPVTGN